MQRPVAMRSRRLIFLSALAFLLAVVPTPAWGGAAASAPADEDLISFQKVSIPDDSPAHLCTALAEGRDGFLWIGTQGGLVRYDGYQLKLYKSDLRNPKTLAGSYLRSLLATSDGRLWVGSFSSGVSVYDPATETFRRYQHDPRNPESLAHDRVEALAEDRAGRIWVATYDGLDRLDPKTGRLRHFRHDPKDPRSLADDQVRAVLVDRSGRVWVGSRDGLQLFLGEAQGFARVASDPGRPETLAGQFVAKLFEDDQGRLWIGTTENGAAVLEPRTGKLRRLLPQPEDPRGLAHFWIYGFTQVGPREVWIATFGGGIAVVDPETLQVVARLRHDAALESTLGGDRVGALLRDRSGVVWVGTWGQGLARYDPAARAFLTLRYSPNRPEGLSHPEVVRTLAARDGTIWVGTNGNGVDVFDRNWRRIGGYRPDPRDPAALSDGSVTCLAQSPFPDSTIWVATLNGALHRQRPGSRQFERLAPLVLPGGPIRTMAFGPDGDLWVGAAEGLARIDPRALWTTIYRHRSADPSTLSGIAVESLAFAADGTLWVGTTSGLNAFDPRRGTAVRILADGRRDGLPANWVPDLLLAADGRLWVATQGGACRLESWDGRTARFLPLTERTGLAPEPVNTLLEDAAGFLWLGPRLRVDPRTWRWQELGAAEGCDLREFFIASRTRTAEGALLFGAPAGLVVVRPERLAPWTYAPPLVATSLAVDGVERAGAARLSRLTLHPGERGFKLHFAALDLTAPLRNSYRYRLMGFDGGWLTSDAAERSAAYTSLPPGGYTLHVQGSNRAGVWSPHELRLRVEVLPAFYQTGLFRAGLVLAILASGYGLYRLRVRRLQARGRELEQQVAERTAALAERSRELEAAYLRIEEASLTDPLTGLRNRRFLEQALDGDLDLAARRHEDGLGQDNADLVFLLLDLDHFKSVNDTYGHGAGDLVLRDTAGLLKGATRASDFVVRWGGEEFLIVARFCDRRDAAALAEQIRRAIAEHRFLLADGTELRRTGSLGYAAYPLSTEEPRALGWQTVVGVADLALYAAKRSGRNRWVGVEVGGAGDPREVVRHFQENPGQAVATGAIRVHTERAVDGGLRWM
ncbi:MAG TPA: two-component regulator propeller domain-containing protein [Thermoanaerobaculia bacterium]|nr:two-component regulator propeller domain-containing protein [Thermoanaerobaculia bacterium]